MKGSVLNLLEALQKPLGSGHRQYDEFFNEAKRLMESSQIGSVCHSMGQWIQGGLGSTYLNDYMWRDQDPRTGEWGYAAGDYHPGTEQVHIAYGIDALNPDRGPDARKETLRHEYAHAMGCTEEENARKLATECGAGGGGGQKTPADEVQ